MYNSIEWTALFLLCIHTGHTSGSVQVTSDRCGQTFDLAETGDLTLTFDGDRLDTDKEPACAYHFNVRDNSGTVCVEFVVFNISSPQTHIRVKYYDGPYVASMPTEEFRYHNLPPADPICAKFRSVTVTFESRNGSASAAYIEVRAFPKDEGVNHPSADRTLAGVYTVIVIVVVTMVTSVTMAIVIVVCCLRKHQLLCFSHHLSDDEKNGIWLSDLKGVSSVRSRPGTAASRPQSSLHVNQEETQYDLPGSV
ncbi:hypothetical protein MAR_016865 [Mya arenaria]|uniref:CUB domain-containing protein n=1 Tax=Mya arenaria TaxID=6604 RepID=A0ABY7EA38_MYAAR|nr:hypothetical protein MAR_016865 [Mya arenaria]